MQNINSEHQQKLQYLFEVYSDPVFEFYGLHNVLEMIQKAYPSDWMARVNDYMQAMSLHDSGQFPDEWFPEEE